MNNLLLFLCNFLINKRNKPYIKEIIQKILYTIKENKYIKEYVREITNLFENDSSIYKIKSYLPQFFVYFAYLSK